MNNEYYFCDKCHKPVDYRLYPKDPTSEYNFCPECALELYRKIFGNKEGEK